MTFKVGQIAKLLKTNFSYRVLNCEEKLVLVRPLWASNTIGDHYFWVDQLELAPPLDQIKYRLDR